MHLYILKIKVTLILLLVGASSLTSGSPTTTEPPMVNYNDATEDPTDPPIVNMDGDEDDDEDPIVIELPEEEDEDRSAEAAMLETELYTKDRELYKVFDDRENDDNSTIEVEPPTPENEDDEDRIIGGFRSRTGQFPVLARLFPTFNRRQFM